MPLMEVKISLDARDVRAVLDGLDELPGKHGRSTHQKIARQVDEQIATYEKENGNESRNAAQQPP